MTESRTPNNILLIFDLISVEVSLFLAIFVRFHRSPGLKEILGSYNGLYPLIFVMVPVIYTVVFFLNDFRHKPLVEQDPFEKTVNVVKNQMLVFIALVSLLYLIRLGYWASRAVVLMLFIFSIIFDTAIRFAYGKYLKKREKESAKPVRYLLLTDTEEEGIVKSLKKLLRPEDGIITGEDPDPSLYDEIMVCFTGKGSGTSLEDLIRKIPETGCPVKWVMNKGGSFTSREMITLLGDVPAISFYGLRDRCPVLGVDFSVSNLMDAVTYIREHLSELKGEYICFGNAHTSVMAYEDREYAGVQNGAAFVMPDGSPISGIQRKRGFLRAGRVAGPDFMGKMFLTSMGGSPSMYFYGASEETIGKLKENLLKNYPGLDIRGLESPPFRELSEEEDRAAVERINASGADILWVGLGAPKQEKWMAAHKGKINALMLGVGAGFDFHAGTVKRAPSWLQKIGLEWLYRLFQDPKRLFKRYVITNIKFMWYGLSDSSSGKASRR